MAERYTILQVITPHSFRGAERITAHYVRALMDQARFRKGLPEPTEPITTGNPVADSVEVTPHDMESYDALFKQPATLDPDDADG